MPGAHPLPFPPPTSSSLITDLLASLCTIVRALPQLLMVCLAFRSQWDSGTCFVTSAVASSDPFGGGEGCEELCEPSPPTSNTQFVWTFVMSSSGPSAS